MLKIYGKQILEAHNIWGRMGNTFVICEQPSMQFIKSIHLEVS